MAFMLGVAALAGGCYWSKYDKLMRTHVVLLQAMADKIVEVTETDGAPQSLAEYRYPLERARDFARIVGRRYAERESLKAFLAFCDAYERVLRLVEARSGPRGTSNDPALLAAARAALGAQASAVIAALDRERAG